ncbi:MAG: hypothetical protein Q7J54_07890 [Candidatus Woesearchaeota archaeon]|nr:hypothetical protein [Candidatus Woesearchaeota archaeon]
MAFNKTKFLQILLILGSIYYLIGAIAHFFGLTIFPFFVKELYSPYHDTMVALVAIVISMLLFVIAKNPIKNIDALKVVIVGGILTVIANIWQLWKIDFVQLGAPAKKLQLIVEMILLMIYIVLLFIFKPKEK